MTKPKLNLGAIPGKVLQMFMKLRVYLFALIMLAIFGYLALVVQSIADPPIDEASFEQSRQELELNRIKFDKETLDEISSRSLTGPSTEPSSTGDPNPFD